MVARRHVDYQELPLILQAKTTQGDWRSRGSCKPGTVALNSSERSIIRLKLTHSATLSSTCPVRRRFLLYIAAASPSAESKATC